MPEDEDMILPDDYEAPPQAEVEQEQEFESDVETEVEDTKPTEEPTETPELDLSPLLKAMSEKAKFNHGPLNVESLEEAITLLQKGAVMDKAVERARQEARDAMVADRGETWNGKPITTEAEYKQALAEQKEYNEIMKIAEREGVPEEFAERMYKLEQRDKERDKESENIRKAQAEQAKNTEQLDNFLNYFQEVNGRMFDPIKDTLSQEVKDAIDKGKPLLEAYMAHETKQLRNQLKVAKQNETNSKKAPVGSVTSHGSTETVAEDDFMRGFNSV